MARTKQQLQHTTPELDPQLCAEYQLTWDRDWARKELARAVQQLASYVDEMQQYLQHGRTLYSEMGGNAATYAAKVSQLAAAVQVYDKAIAGVVSVAYQLAHKALEAEAAGHGMATRNLATYTVKRRMGGVWYTAYNADGTEVYTTRYKYEGLRTELLRMGYVLVGGPQK